MARHVCTRRVRARPADASMIGKTVMNDVSTCPCGAGAPYADCCGAFIDGEAVPDSAERLMRSRYTAYTLAREAYLLRTWHSTTRPTSLGVAVTPAVKWLGLKIQRVEQGGPQDQTGTVELTARYKLNGRAHRLHEVSRFVREAGEWRYLEGTFSAAGATR